MRLRTPLVALLLVATVLAGCTAPENAPEADPAPSRPGPKGPAGAAPGHPTDHAAPVEDAGDIAGPFQKTWDLHVASVAFREAHVEFALAGAQPGAPPTARVQFSLLDPEGNVVKTALVGLGGDSDTLSWTLRAADLPAPGTYTLQAVNGVSADPTSLATPGLAKYTLHAQVLY